MSRLRSGIRTKGSFHIEHRDKDGNLKGVYDIPNGVTRDGRNLALNVLFKDTAKIANWYMGLINQASYTGINDTDTHQQHPGWIEFTGYSEAARPAWAPAAYSTLQTITNTTPITFTINVASGTLKGIFIASVATKSDVGAGTLWATSLFPADVPIANTDVLKITYTVNALSS